jgi:transposase
VCVRDGTGAIQEEKKVETDTLAAYLQRKPRSRVVMETCAESWAVGDAARAADHDLRIVPGSLVKALGVGQRRIKTDRKDAQILSEVSTRIDLPSVHLRSPEARELQTKLHMRGRLVASRTMLINSVRGWLRTQALRIRTGATHTFPERVRRKIEALPAHVARQLDTVAALTEGIQAATGELKALAEAHPVARRLSTVPGIGPMTALAFVAAVDDPTRFPNAHRLESYLGLTPGEHSSSGTTRRTSITKAGRSSLRHLLVEAAWTVYVHQRRSPLGQWAEAIEQRRGRKIALVGLARKLAGICFAVWRDGRTYQASRAAEAGSA